MYSDSDSEEDNYNMLDDALPVLKRLARPKVTKNSAKRFVDAVAASKISPSVLVKQIFGSDCEEILDIDSLESSNSYHTPDSDVMDEAEEVADLVTPESTIDAPQLMLSLTLFSFIQNVAV